MIRYIVTTGTITHAIKGRDLLRKKGIKAYVEKNSVPDKRKGCSYSIIAEGGNKGQIEAVLKGSGVNIIALAEA